MLNVTPYDKESVHPFGRCRGIVANGIEIESVMLSHSLARNTLDPAVKRQLALVRRIEAQQLAAEKSVGRELGKLMRLVEHHVEEEETGMFPDMRQTDTDLYEVGGRLAARRVEALLSLRRAAG